MIRIGNGQILRLPMAFASEEADGAAAPNLIHSFFFRHPLLRIVAECSLHAWGEQSSTKKHIRLKQPAHKVEEGALAS